jgi:5-methylcytosine-specific restriction endonuclease McrA
MPKKLRTTTQLYGPKPARTAEPPKRYRHPRWRKQWANLRTLVLQRDLYVCQCDGTDCNHDGPCGHEGNEVHHLVPWRNGGAWDDLENLATYCRACHSRATAREQAERRCK